MTGAVRTPVRIDFVADVICPFCWVGWARLKRALKERPLIAPQIVWRAFQLDPTTPPEGIDRKAYLAAKFPEPGRVEGMHRNIEDMGRGEGLEFRFDAIPRTPNTVGAHQVILWAAAEDKQDAAVEALFKAYFHDGRDIGDPETLAAIAGEVGMDPAAAARRLAEGEDAALIGQAYRSAAQAGITGVPFYIFDQKVGLPGAQPPETILAALEQAQKTAAVRPAGPAA